MANTILNFHFDYLHTSLSDTHQVSISQQMSRVIAFDIAVVAQKVKVVNEDRCDLFGGGSLVRNRKGSQSNRKDAD